MPEHFLPADRLEGYRILETVLVTVVIVLTVLVAVDLVLTAAVMRRLREHDAVLRAPLVRPPNSPTLPVGSRVPEFAAQTSRGAVNSDELLADNTLFAFVSPGCVGCEEDRPRLTAELRRRADAGQTSVVVVTESSTRIREYESTYGALAQVVADGPVDGPVTTAFAVRAYPSYALVHAGVLQASAGDIDELSTAATAKP